MKPRQLTLRAIFTGMFLGGFMSLSNLYTSLKVGWSFGVTITAGILAFALFSVFTKLKIVKNEFGLLENNAMQSVASAAGYMTGGGTVAAIPALMMITGQSMNPWVMFIWISVIALLGVIMAIPMKQQMINVEQLRFPSGIAAAETLKALHSHTEGNEINRSPMLLGWGGIAGAVVAFFRDAHAKWIPFNIPEKFALLPQSVQLHGKPLTSYTLSFEGSLMMLAAGAIMGWRVAWSMLLGALVNFAVIAPWLYSAGIINPKLGYKNIMAWSVWFGSALILTSGLLSFAFQWKTVLRAVKSVSHAFTGKKLSAAEQNEFSKEVPMHWFFIGLAILSPIVIACQWFFFGIKPWMGAIAVVLSFFIAIVASRATGETDTTPTGALGKITQLTFGALDAGNVTTNLMTANVTGGVGLHAADLLTDLKSGYLLDADPKQQFWAQFFGVLAGSLFVVPAYNLLVPTAADLGGDRWPAPGAQTWKGVAEMLSKGFHTLHPTAQHAIWIGASMGIALVLLEKFFPKQKRFIPSAMGIGLGFTSPAYNTISMFMGGVIALIWEKKKSDVQEKIIIPVSSGMIAGESLMGVLIAALVMAGLLQG